MYSQQQSKINLQIKMSPSHFARALIALVLTRGALASISGPVIQNTNFPDPSVINFGGLWYAFGTGTSVNIPYATSPDFNTWTLQTTNGVQNNALPTLPAWAVSTDPTTVWAPDVNQLVCIHSLNMEHRTENLLQADGSFVMYFSAATVANTSQHCIGAAKSTTITGPYSPTSDTPLFCPSAQGGAIDASGFLDSSGQRYVVYKVDGNSIGSGGDCGNDVAPFVPTPIILQPVNADGITLSGNAYQIMNNNGMSCRFLFEQESAANNILRVDGHGYHRSPKSHADSGRICPVLQHRLLFDVLLFGSVRYCHLCHGSIHSAGCSSSHW